MKKNADISIIIPNLHSPIIHKTISSLLNQETDYQFEIIVVGQDKYCHLENFIDNRLINIRTDKPCYPAMSRNKGAEVARGDYLFFIDADCIASPNWINMHMNMHEKASGTSLIGGGVDFPSNNYFTLVDNVSTFHEYMLHIPAGFKEQLPTLNLSLNKSIWISCGGFNENLPVGEDAELTTRMRRRGYSLFFLPEACITHLPSRHRIKDLVQHAFRFGRFSIKADEDYRDSFFVPFILRNWLLVILFSPMLAIYVIIKIIFIEKLPVAYWQTLPGVFFLKMVWCFGFALRLFLRNKVVSQIIK